MIKIDKEFDINFYRKEFPNDNGFKNKRVEERLVIGQNTKTVIKNIKSRIKHPRSRQKQVATALEIVSCLNSPYSPLYGTQKTGLVVGRVQSGKTTSFTLASAVAADNGTRLIIQMLGTKENLLKSNLHAVKTYLDLYRDRDDWIVAGIDAGGGVELDITAQQLAYNLGKNQISRNNNQKKVVFISLMKNKAHISHLVEILKDAKLDQFRDLNTLIIDDEVDSHTPDISKPNEKTSSINRSVKSLIDVCGTCSFIGYTATSAGIKYAHQRNFISPDFHVLLPPGDGYVGNEELFGKPELWLKYSNPKNKKGTYQHQIKEIKCTQIKDKSTKKEKLIDDKASLKESMRLAVCDFLISQEIFGSEV